MDTPRSTFENQVIIRTVVVLSLLPSHVVAGDWPTYRNDNFRGGQTDEKIDAPRLVKSWTFQSPHPPQPAWGGPAKWDAYAKIKNLRSLRDYDSVFHAIVVGTNIYFGSSVDDSLHCLDTKTGKRRWRFTTDGPVRIAPAHANGHVYFGSDDGYAYCVNARTGKLIWKFTPAEAHTPVINNGKLISFWPVRTGVLVADGTAYFANSMLPWKHSYLCAVDAVTGKATGKGRYVKKIEKVTLEGSPLASPTQLIIPQGRVAPLTFRRSDGKPLGSLEGGGGSFVLMTPDQRVMHGPGKPKDKGKIIVSNVQTRAKVASYAQGNAIVVDGDITYILTDRELGATDIKAKKRLWRTASNHPHAMILAADTIFIGGDNEVAAIETVKGEKVWTAKVNGRAHGLAVANGALYVSTDSGAIHCFRPGGKPVAPKPQLRPKPAPRQRRISIQPFTDKDLIGRWVFQHSAVIGQVAKGLVGKLNATVHGDKRIESVSKVQALMLDGVANSALITDDHNEAKLPARHVTAEAWVRVDQPTKWGGIIGAIQDNGSYERGWILGYSDNRFSFAVAAKKAEPKLSYLAAKSTFRPGQWYHVVGTYDGAAINIYVNGKLEATSREQNGDIAYPPRAFYEIGAYHDKDENFRMRGGVHEVRVYKRAISAADVKRNFVSKQKLLPEAPAATETTDDEGTLVAAGPWVRFTSPTTAEIVWHTKERVSGIVELRLGEQIRQIKAAPTQHHRVGLTGLKRDRVYKYRVSTKVAGKSAMSREYELDTYFNYSPPVVTGESRSARDAVTANSILASARIDRGICLVLGVDSGQLALELAKQSELRIIGFDTSPARVEAARRLFHDRGIYGARARFHQIGSFDQLNIPDEIANLIVSEKPVPPGKPARILKLLKPSGGVACFSSKGWFKRIGVASKIITGLSVYTRSALDNTGEWTHMYGRADNSAYGGEPLAGVKTAEDLRVHWLGRPGARYQADRNGRKPGPLSANGRLFLQGLNRIIAVDAYNGAVHWSLEIPHFERFNMPRDCANWCVDNDHVYAAVRDKCIRIDARDGRVAALIDVETKGARSDWEYDWGYVASDGDRLIGSAVKRGTSFTNFWGAASAGWYDSRDGAVTHKVCSESIFAIDKQSGATRWTYADGVIINPTITIGGGRIYFVESRNAAVKASRSRRVSMSDMWKDQFLVALDAKSGKKLWDKPIDTTDGTIMFSMAYGTDRLVVVGSKQDDHVKPGKKKKEGKYFVNTFSAFNGKQHWDNTIDWPNDGHHGSHMSRPAIVGNKIFLRPGVLDLVYGKRLKMNMPNGGCGTYVCTDQAVFYRKGSGNISGMWSTENQRYTGWNRLRPDCWISTIPAGGMLLSPEGGGGCSCGKWLETSIGFRPMNRK